MWSTVVSVGLVLIHLAFMGRAILRPHPFAACAGSHRRGRGGSLSKNRRPSRAGVALMPSSSAITLFILPAVYVLLAKDHSKDRIRQMDTAPEMEAEPSFAK